MQASLPDSGRSGSVSVSSMFSLVQDFKFEAGFLTRNQAAYSAGTNSSVRMVAEIRPPIIATAIGPQKFERDSGIIASTAASAVSTIGLKRRTVASTIASHCGWP